MASQAVVPEPKKSITNEPLEDSVQPIPSENVAKNEVAALAYQLWQERGCPIGSDQEDWFRAERKIAGSKGMNQREVGSQSSVEQSIDAEEADSSALRFPVRSEVSKRRLVSV